jgi:hypothetical protein
MQRIRDMVLSVWGRALSGALGVSLPLSLREECGKLKRNVGLELKTSFKLSTQSLLGLTKA